MPDPASAGRVPIDDGQIGDGTTTRQLTTKRVAGGLSFLRVVPAPITPAV
jgi:hypothetical protein